MSKRRFAPAGVRGDNWQGCMLMCVHALCVPTLCVLVCVPAQCVPALCVLMCVPACQCPRCCAATRALLPCGATSSGRSDAQQHRSRVFRCVGA